jgi:hypothetical protein
MVPREMLDCDERCVEGGKRCHDLTVDSPEGPRVVAVLHWRVVAFIVRADTGEMMQVPDDGDIRIPVTEKNWPEFPLQSEIRNAQGR